MAWLLTFACMAAFVGLFFYLRRRREEQREAEDARAQAFLIEMGGAQGGQGGASEPERSSPSMPRAPAHDAAAHSGVMTTSEERPVMDAPATAPATAARGPVYLERSHQVVWHWLKASLPGYEIFARGSLRRVVGKDRVQKDMLLDFVICDARLRVAGVVDLERPRQDPAAQRFKREVLDEVAVRYACWNAAQLPGKTFVREWLEMPGVPAGSQDEIER